MQAKACGGKKGCDLRKVDLSWTDLRKIDLGGADLREANLNWADLSGADLSWTDLSEADLSRADLSGACVIDVQGDVSPPLLATGTIDPNSAACKIGKR